MPILYPAPPWRPPRAEFLRLWHGCLRSHADAIAARGVDVTVGNPDTDFGRGFYTTTVRRQARQWAMLRHYGVPFGARGLPDNEPVTLWFRVPRARLAALESLHFVLGDFNSLDYWSLAQHCRRSARATPTAPAVIRDPGYLGPRGPWYDVVTGPVAAFWEQRVAMDDADQFSFHTDPGAAVLNDLLRSGRRDVDWGVELVPRV